MSVERTWLSRTASIVALVAIIGLIFLFFSLQLELRVTGTDWGNRMWLDNATLDRIEKVVNENRALTETELREITTQQLRNVLDHQRPKPEPGKNKRLLLFFGLPFLVLVAVSVYLIGWCYPDAVFFWGDEVSRYNALEQRRKILWGIIFAVFVSGVVAKLLSEGVLSWIGR